MSQTTEISIWFIDGNKEIFFAEYWTFDSSKLYITSNNGKTRVIIPTSSIMKIEEVKE
jgi:hypothetical protein